MSERSRIETGAAQRGLGRRSALVSVGALATAAGVGWGWWSSRGKSEPVVDQGPNPTSSVGDGFWAQTYAQPNGGVLALKTFQGRPLIVNFWATWCAPCVEELPLLDAFYAQNLAKRIQLIGIAADKIENVTPFLGRLPLRFPIALAGFAGIQASKDLGNLSGGLPFTVALDSQGAIIQRRMGIVQPQDLRSWAELR